MITVLAYIKDEQRTKASSKMKLILVIVLVAFAHGVRSEDLQLSDKDLISTGAEACDSSACDRECKGLGWKGGFCSGGDCYCWKSGRSGDLETQSLKQIQLSDSQTKTAACDTSACDRECKGLGWKGGFCSGGDCYCWKSGRSGDLETQSLKQIQLSGNTRGNARCDNAHCNRRCLKARWIMGACRGDACWCQKFGYDNPEMQLPPEF